MSELTFSCPHCAQKLEVPEEMLGQATECPACHGRIDSPAPETKETKDCSFCGEEILATARKCKHCGEFLDGTARPAPQSAPQKRSEGPEETLWTAHTSMLYYIPMLILGVLLIPLLVGVLIIVYAVLDQRFRVFTVTNRRVVSRRGIIGRKTREVAICDIRAINMSQGILERIFGLGSVGIGSAGTAALEVKFAGVVQPTSVRDLVREAKEQHG